MSEIKLEVLKYSLELKLKMNDMSALKIAIIDDEENARNALSGLLKNNYTSPLNQIINQRIIIIPIPAGSQKDESYV